MRVVLYTSAGGFVFESWGVQLSPSELPEVWLWSGRAFIRNELINNLHNCAGMGYVEATVGTLPARTDA